MSAIETLDQVFRLAALGWKVYPVSRPDYTGTDPGKSPWCPGGFRDGTSAVTTLCQWAEKKQGCNWGVWPCDGVVVLDVDLKHGGIDVLNELEAKYGPLPPTVCCQTSGGGRHYYFACPKDFQAKLSLCGCPGLSLIATKGGVIVPPSVHPSGKPYVWHSSPWTMTQATIPDWLLALAQGQTSDSLETRPAKDLDTLTWGGGAVDFTSLGALPDGDRNVPVCRVIGILLKGGVSEEDVLEQALAWADAHDYDPDEMRRKVKSLAKVDREQQTPPPFAQAPASVIVSVGEGGSEGVNSAEGEFSPSLPGSIAMAFASA